MSKFKQMSVVARHCVAAATILWTVASSLPGQYLVPQPSASWPSPQQYRSVTADFNNNGIPDAVCIEMWNSAGTSNGWPNYYFVPDPAFNGVTPGAVHNFSCPGGYAFLQGANSTAVADFNSDGNVDIAIGIGFNNGLTYQVVVFPGLGNGQFGPGNPAQLPFSGTNLRTLDVNNDGATDILTRGSSGGATAVLGQPMADVDCSGHCDRHWSRAIRHG